MAERLQKFLARSGIGSRRNCEELIKLNKVLVNGQIAKIGCSVSQNDIVEYDGNYNLDLNGNLKDTLKNIENFLEDTINKYLLTNDNDKDYHTFNDKKIEKKKLIIELNGSSYEKCKNCTSFIKIS